MKWYNLHKINNQVEIDLFDEIGGWGVYAKEFKDEVSSLVNSSSEDIIVNINSPGGSVFEGIEIYNYLKGLPNKVTVKINSLAASIATIVALGGDELHISESAFFMIHNPWSIAMGEADDMRKQADVLDKIKETILSIYEKNSNLDRERLTAIMDEETWLTGSEAVEYGFADQLTEGVKVAAMATTDIINNFKNIPNSLKMAENTENQEQKSVLEKIKALLSSDDTKNELQERYAELSEEVKALKESNADLEGTLEEAYNTLKTEKDNKAVELADKDKEINAKIEEINAKDKEIEALKAEIQAKTEEVQAKVKEVEELNAKLSEETGEDLTDNGKEQDATPKAKKTFAEYLRDSKK